MLAGSGRRDSAALRYLASQSDWLEGIKKAPELTAQEPKTELKPRPAIRLAQLYAE
jgi:hypothetical protein